MIYVIYIHEVLRTVPGVHRKMSALIMNKKDTPRYSIIKTHYQRKKNIKKLKDVSGYQIMGN